MKRAFWLASALALVAGCPGTPPASDAGGADSPSASCTRDLDCNDGRYCNGPERCMSGRCEAGVTPCMPSQQCIDAEARCVTICALDPDADGDGVVAVGCMGTDCDDADPQRFPGHAEVCDDAAHDEDCNPTTFGARDRDGDGDVDAACCNVDPASNARICGGDCADQRRDVRSLLAEACDGLDNDCDGMIDEAVTRMGAPDADFDLHGDSDPAMARAGCAGEPGFSSVTDDCRDMDPGAFGAQLEICDGVDNNCNGMSDERMGQLVWYPDDDGDGFGAGDVARLRISCAPIPGFTTRAGDCDDHLTDVHPGASERCNGRDDDCNGRADYRIAAGDTEDDDGDEAADQHCGGGDCDDASAAIGPAAPELMDGLDNDCDGMVDDSPVSVSWWIDLDRDGWGDAASTPTMSATPIVGRVTRGQDCDDGNVYIHPRTADLCDGVDDDCDGHVDESSALLAFYPDADHDGWATTSTSAAMLACRAPAGLAGRIGDCADSDAMQYPGAPELCNGHDDDCDTLVDETPAPTWYVDQDGDGWGEPPGIPSCTAITGRVSQGGDCDDTNAQRHPTQQELCNGGDDDCDTRIDEMAAASCTGPFVASAACTAGACVVTCASGRGDCDGMLASGCEVDTAHASGHCGACFAACGLGDSCARTAAAGTCDVAPWAELAGGGHTMFARRATGGVVVWGATHFESAPGVGSLGTSDPQVVPVLAGVSDVVELATSVAGGCARRTSGQVQCWGTIEGPTGGGTPYPAPTTIVLPRPARSVGAADHHSCAVLDDGSAYCWGYRTFGILGGGVDDNMLVAPTRVMELGAPVDDAIAVTCGYLHTCLLRERIDGTRYVSCFGDNAHGALALGLVGGAHLDASEDAIGLPTDLVAFSRGDRDATCVRDVRGRAWCWGNNYYSRVLGLGNGAPNDQPTPVTPPGLESGVLDLVFVPYEGANDFTGGGACAIRAGMGGVRELLCWGAQTSTSNAMFLGDGLAHGRTIFVPTAVGPPGSEVRDAIAVARTRDTTCVARASGGIWCAGIENDGSLGDGPSVGPTNMLVRVMGLP